MNVPKDNIAEIAQKQKVIQDYLGLSSESLIFEYNKLNEGVKLDLITVNPRHNQSFLFHSVIGVDRLDALSKMIEYVKSNHNDEESYTIQWTAKGNHELHTSYFRAKNMYQALDKLYYGRDINLITVFIIKLNPIS